MENFISLVLIGSYLQLYLLLHGVRCVGSLRSRRHPDMLAALAALEPLASLALCAPLRSTAHIRTLNRAIRLCTRYARFRIAYLLFSTAPPRAFGLGGCAPVATGMWLLLY